MSEGGWIPSGEAVARLKNNSDDPQVLLVRLLQTGDVAARAGSVYRDGALVTHPSILEKDSNAIKASVWHSVIEFDWRAGVFGFSSPAPTKYFGVGEVLHWSITGVSINWLEVLQRLGPLSTTTQKMRASSFKSARGPDRATILAKADEMKASGMDGRTIAKEMRLIPGFENVYTTEVRELIKGRWEPSGRPKKAP
jgi:hypothetical protein